MRPRLGRAYVVDLWLAAGWTIVNCLCVYLALKGDRAYRIASAALIGHPEFVRLTVGR